MPGLINNIEIAIFAKEVAPIIVSDCHRSRSGEVAGIKRTNLESMGIFFQATMIPFFIIVKRGPERINV